MSLRVWLPLDGNLKNNGLCDIPLDNNGATVDDNGKIGKCYLFNGSARISDTVARDYAYPLTCMCWFNATTVSGGTRYILSVNQSTTGSPGHIIGFGFVNGKLCAFVGGTYTPYSVSLVANTWYHVAVTIDIDKNWKLYVNGENVQSGTCGTPPASKWFTIGARCDSATGGAGGANYYFSGSINDVRLYDDALSEYEIKEISRGLIRHYKFDDLSYGKIIDSSGYNYNSEKNNIVLTDTDSGRNSNCSVLSGSVYSEFAPMPTTVKSVSFWVKTTWTTPSDHQVLFADKGSQIAFGISSSGNAILNTSDVSTKVCKWSTTGYAVNAWNHIVIVKTGSNTRNLYVNGVLATLSSSKDGWTMSKTKMDIGCRNNGSYASYFTGNISDFRAYVTELTQYDISQLYEVRAKITKNTRLHACEISEPEYTEVNTIVEDTDIAYIDDALGRPVTDLHITINPIVDGTGDPSESNIKNISGTTGGLLLNHCGNNLYDQNYVQDHLQQLVVDGDGNKRYGYEFKLPPGEYTVTANWVVTPTTSYYYSKIKYADGTFSGVIHICSGKSLTKNFFTLGTGDSYIIYNGLANGTVESTQTLLRRFNSTLCNCTENHNNGAYTQFHSEVIDVAFPSGESVIYCGSYNVLTGELSVKWKLYTITSVVSCSDIYTCFVLGDYGYVDADLTSSAISNILKCHTGTASAMPVGYFKVLNSSGYNRAHICICFEGCRGGSSTETANLNNTKLSALNQAGTPLQVLVPLATPRTYQLGARAVKTFSGANTFYAMGAKVGVTYKSLGTSQNSTVQISNESVANATGLYINKNILEKNPIAWVSSDYMAGKFALTQNLEAGKTYTLQLWSVDVSNEGRTEDTLGVVVFWGGGSIRILQLVGTTYFTNGHADYICASFSITSSQASGATAVNAWLQIYNSSPNTSQTMSMTIGKWKLEEGNKPTAYIEDSASDTYVRSTHGFIETEFLDNTVSGKVYKGHYEFNEFNEI